MLISILTADLRKALKVHTRKAKPTGIELGSGTYGTVIELTSVGETVAGKVFKTSSTIGDQLMSKLREELDLMVNIHHPNIVQCKGVCFLRNHTMPVLLMERMINSLHAYLLDPIRSNLALDRKVSISHDVASGLVYLHSRIPAIIHRDLTAKNVLLDSELRAKIADFGNARIMDLDPETTPETFTSLPGTRDYMPPEAEGGSTKYDPSLDVFSFGHLMLFTIIQSPVHPLLPSTYTDDEGLHARSEVKRREQYLDKAEQILGEEHSLVVLIKQCLHNYPARRPQAAELVTKLQGILSTLGGADGMSLSQPNAQVELKPAECQAFQKCFAVLSEGISDPSWLAVQLYSRDMISRDIRQEGQLETLPASVRTHKLLSAVEDQITTSPTSKFRDFLDILNSDTSLEHLAKMLEEACTSCSKLNFSSKNEIYNITLVSVQYGRILHKCGEYFHESKYCTSVGIYFHESEG